MKKAATDDNFSSLHLTKGEPLKIEKGQSLGLPFDASWLEATVVSSLDFRLRSRLA
jgi:hypothetical protein